MRGNLGDRFDESHDRVCFHAVEHADPRALEQRTAQRFELESGEAAAQGMRHRGGMRVGRWLAGRDVDPRHGRAAASGEALIASATR